jgi:hypothetical protein
MKPPIFSAASLNLGLRDRFEHYIRDNPAPVIAIDALRVSIVFATLLAGPVLLRALATGPLVLPLHYRLWSDPEFELARWVYTAALSLTTNLLVGWVLRTTRNFLALTIIRLVGLSFVDESQDSWELPPFPYSRESFTVVLGEMQDRDGSPVPNPRARDKRPRWLTLPERALYTGVFVSGGIGSGKTSAVAYPVLKQLIGFRRPVQILRNGRVETDYWRCSGVVLDEKGDFTRAVEQFCKEWDRSDDFICISPGGEWKWNPIFNPNLPTWATAYQLGWILKAFNKGRVGSDPFWDNAPKELLLQYLSLINAAEGYYTIADYLDTLSSDERQDELYEKAKYRLQHQPEKLAQLRRMWADVQRRRTGMGHNLRGSLEACAKAGLEMFRFNELSPTFCPTKDEYFERGADGKMRPRAKVFTGFDSILDYGKIIGLSMSKQMSYEAAVFIQMALKQGWKDAVLRRESEVNGKLTVSPRFGNAIGHCPTFLMADEAQQSVTPQDQEFKAMMRSKRAILWELSQSHSSVEAAFGNDKAHDAAAFFQNSMTGVFLRQSDPKSRKLISEECSKRMVPRISFSVTEGGAASSVSYAEGGIVHDGLNFSRQKSVAAEEKPFVEPDQLKRLPNNVAIVLPSNGDNALEATVVFLRPSFLFDTGPNGEPPRIDYRTPWHRWEEKYRGSYDLDNIPQELLWQPPEHWTKPIPEDQVLSAESLLGDFVQDSAKFWPLPEPIKPDDYEQEVLPGVGKEVVHSEEEANPPANRSEPTPSDDEYLEPIASAEPFDSYPDQDLR